MKTLKQLNARVRKKRPKYAESVVEWTAANVTQKEMR